MLGIVYFVLALNAYTISASFITPCKSDDSACIITSTKAAIPFFAKGVPEMKLIPLDPLKLELVETDQAGLKITMKDTTLTGLKDCDIKDIRLDSAKSQQHMSLKCNLVLVGDYKLDGKLLIFTVQGEGKYKIDIRDMVIKVTSDVPTITGKDGKPHWHVTKWTHSFDVLTGTTFDFENLFNGNKALADPVTEFMNTNWKDVMQEISPPIVDIIISKVINNIDKFYKHVPLSDLQL